MKPIRIIISGGGTGGHVFPAIAIANAIRTLQPDAEILFVGALGKMEMEKVPQAGYRIEGLPIVGVHRRLTWKNLLVPFQVIKSLIRSRSIIRSFNPDIAVGVGGYASGPLLRAAASIGIPTIIQEQNSFPGITNRILASRARLICVAYGGMEKWFPADKIMLTGNPVRQQVADIAGKRDEAIRHFQLDVSRPVILAMGGSLGARTMNDAVQAFADKWIEAGCQVIWQSGKGGAEQARIFAQDRKHLLAQPFIAEMDLAYAAADIILSRAGAMSISELCLVGKPCIFIPSPHVAEDHQTHNAMALVHEGAALLVSDRDATTELGRQVLDLITDHSLREALSTKIRKLGRPDAAITIAGEVMRIAHATRNQ